MGGPSIPPTMIRREPMSVEYGVVVSAMALLVPPAVDSNKEDKQSIRCVFDTTIIGKGEGEDNDDRARSRRLRHSKAVMTHAIIHEGGVLQR